MELFRHFPTFRLPLYDEPLIPLAERGNYPAFTTDFETLDHELMPLFYKFDYKARRQQNLYRWMYIILIFGGSLTTIFGVLQFAFPSTPWPGILGAVIALFLTVTTALLRSFKYQQKYLSARLATEQFRNTYFLFLGHYDPFNDDQTRLQTLRQHVHTIKKRGEL